MIMTVYALLGGAFVILAIVMLTAEFIAHLDFVKRKFESKEERQKWFIQIYFRPLGCFYYLCTIRKISKNS